MSNSLIYFSPIVFQDKPKNIPGLDSFLKLQKIFSAQNGIKDRTQTIVTPFKQTILFPLPEFKENFKLSYTDCAMNQVSQIEKIYNQTGKKLRLLYSGGIDSSGILAAFIGYFGMEKTSKILEICCSKESIYENPHMWEKYIAKNNFKLLSSHYHTELWEDNVTTIMGEGNDQLLGITNIFVNWRNFTKGENLFRKVDEDMLINFLNTEFYYKMTDKNAINAILNIIKVSPFLLDNMFKISWWLYLTIGWECIMLRSTCAANRSAFPKDFYNNGLIQFYSTGEFQQWSCNYIKNSNESTLLNYKAPTKNMILDILDLPGYENKAKSMSWPRLQSMIPYGLMIDDENRIHRNIEDFNQFIDPNNSFI